MENLHITRTNKIPEVNFSTSGQLNIWGLAFLHPEPKIFWKELYDFLEVYALNPAPQTNVSFGLEFTDRKSWKRFMTFIEHICKIQDSSHQVYILWHIAEYEEPVFKEYIGQWLQTLGVPFDLIEVDEIR